MKKNTRFAVLSLAISCLFPLCSCRTSTPENNPAEPVAIETPESKAETETSVFDAFYSKVPVEDFNGESFDFLNFIDCDWANTIMSAEEITGETLNDAIYHRNETVSEKLNISLNEHLTPNGQIHTTMLTAITAGDDAYDVFWGFTQYCAGLLNKEYLHNIKTINNIHLDAPWYSHSLNQQMNFGDSYYMLFGDAHMGFYQAMYVWGFNKTVLENHNLEDPYKLYYDGTWTWDTMFSMATSVSADLNGNGKYDIQEDMYGLGIAASMGVCFLHTSGYNLTERDADNFPIYNGVSEPFYDAYAKVCTYLFNSLDIVAVSDLNSTSNDVWDQAFQENRCLFVMDAIGAFADHRESDVSYGLVSVPKYTEEQKEYITPTFYNSMALYIPITNAKLDMTGTILENLYAESYQTVRSAFIESVVYYKFARDELSIQMLESCIDNVSVEIAYVYNWGNLHTTIAGKLKSQSLDLASAIQATENKINTDIEKTIKTFTEE